MTRLHIGSLGDGSPVYIDTEDRRFKRQGIRGGTFAGSGFGKGYLMGVIAEETIGAGLPTLMVDPESELWTFREIGAFVAGGPHGHLQLPPVPPPDARGHIVLPPTWTEVVRTLVEFCLDTATPTVIDLNGLTPKEIRAAVEVIADVYWTCVNQRRQPSVFMLTEAHLAVPEKLPRGAVESEVMPRLLSGGRKRGVLTFLETQRSAEIANDVIGHCNVPIIGGMNMLSDFKAVRDHLPEGVDFRTLRDLETGVFYLPTVTDGLVHVRERRVTHGAVTPGSTDSVQLRQEPATPRAMNQLAERLGALIQQGAAREAAVVASTPAPRSRREEPLERPHDDPAARITALTHQLTTAQQELADTRERLRAAEASKLALQDEVHRMADQNAAAERLKAAFIEFVGGIPAGEGGGLSRADVITLIREHGGGGRTVTLTPVEVLQERYLEAAAERLYERVRGLPSIELRVWQFLLAHPSQQGSTSISVALHGQSGGGGNAYTATTAAIQRLEAEQLIEQYRSGSNRCYRPTIQKFLDRELKVHAPTPAQLDQVRDRVLWLLEGNLS